MPVLPGPGGPAPLNRAGTPRTAAAAALLFALALGAALLFVFSSPLPDVKNDAVGYLALARSVASGTGFSEDGGATPAVYRPPLFAALLGGWFLVTGTSTVLSAAVFQSLVHGLGVVVAFLLFLDVGASLAAAAAVAVFLAASPLLVTRVAFVLLEPTVLLFTALAAWASVRLIRAPSPGRAALAGAAWGVCALSKVVCWFAPILLLGMRVLPARLRWSWRVKDAALLLLCFAAAIAPWTARNYMRFHRFIPVNGQARGMLEWNIEHAAVPGEPRGAEILAEISRTGRSADSAQGALWGYIREHPRYFLVDRTIRNAISFAAPPRDWWIARGLSRPGEHRAGYWVLAALFHIPLYLLLLYRTSEWVRGRAGPSLGFLLLFYWAYWAEHAVIWGDPRFGLAVYPLLVGLVLPLDRQGDRVGWPPNSRGG